MALVVKDRVKETTATTGTGTLTLAGAVTGFQSFSSALSNGDTTYYAIFESSTGEWEVGLGTFTLSGTTLARTTVLASSNSGSAVNLTAGSAEVFITQPATKAAYFDASGDLVLNQDPTSALQAATKQYVDTIAAAGVHYHDPVRVEQEGNLTVTYNNGTAGVGATLTNAGTQAALVIDGVTMVVNDRVLIYEQTDQTQNGIYTVTNVGSASTNWVLTRATDADSYGPSDPDALGQGDAFFVSEGAAGAGETYVMTTEGTITFGTTNITFSQISATQIYSAGDGLTLTGTTFAAGAGTGVTVNANDIAIGQAIGTSDSPTFAGLTTTANISFGDNDKAVFGASSDLQIYHNGTNSVIVDNGAGNLSLQSNGTEVNVWDVSNSQFMAQFISGAQVSLRYNGSEKFNTLSTGVNVTGNIAVSGTVDGRDVATDGTKLDGIEANADVTDTTNVVAALTAGTNITIAGDGTISSTDTNTTYSAGTALDLSGTTFNVDLSELTTSTSDGDGDFFVVVDSVNAQKKLTKANINISGFNNDAGYTTNVGDITGVTAGSYITGGGTSGTVTVNVDATSANTASKVVARDGSGNFSAGTITANLTGTASNANLLDNLDSSQFLRSDANDTTSGTLSVEGGQIVINDSSGYAELEMGGPSGAYIDLKSPSTDDYDGRIQYDGSNFLLTTNADQPVQLRHNNSTKLATTSSGISVSGNASVTGGNLYVGVNDSVAGIMTVYGAGTGTTEGAEIRLHASADYDNVIEHWNIDVNQDDLRMFTSAGDLAFVARPDAQVELYYNGSKKFETTSGGALVSGVLDVSSRVESDDYRSATNQQIQIQAGESWNYSTGQTGEYVYLNGDNGVQINCSPDNWASGWAGRDTFTFSSSGLQFPDGSSQSSAGASTGKAIAMAIVFG